MTNVQWKMENDPVATAPDSLSRPLSGLMTGANCDEIGDDIEEKWLDAVDCGCWFNSYLVSSESFPA